MSKINKLYKYRFELFLLSQIAIDYGSLVFSLGFFEAFMSPLFSLLNLLAGILLVSKKKYYLITCVVLLMISSVLILVFDVKANKGDIYSFLNVSVFFIFYGIITIEIISQVWSSKRVGKNVILGLISGFMSLAFIGFFICLTIEMLEPGSFKGLLNPGENSEILIDRIKYYSYITIMTIGFGDIVPVTTLAQRGTMLIGLAGQFYLVIITSTIVGKYVSQIQQTEDNHQT